MKLQAEISKEISKRHIGKVLNILLEERSFDGKYYVGRSYMDVPDIDGIIYVKCDKVHKEGEFVKARVISVEGYDLIAEIE